MINIRYEFTLTLENLNPCLKYGQGLVILYTILSDVAHITKLIKHAFWFSVHHCLWGIWTSHFFKMAKILLYLTLIGLISAAPMPQEDEKAEEKPMPVSFIFRETRKAMLSQTNNCFGYFMKVTAINGTKMSTRLNEYCCWL